MHNKVKFQLGTTSYHYYSQKKKEKKVPIKTIKSCFLLSYPTSDSKSFPIDNILISPFPFKKYLQDRNQDLTLIYAWHTWAFCVYPPPPPPLISKS